MLSRAEIRETVENVLSGVVIGLLAIFLSRSLQRQGSVAESPYAARGTASLAQWSMQPKPPAGIHVGFDKAPSPLERDWMRALQAAGSRVTWSGNLPAVMIAASPVASPAGGTRVRVAAPNGSNVVVSDDVGVVDSVRAQNSGASVTLASESHGSSAQINGSTASTVQADSVRLGKLLVIGNAGWESKFVVASLEEEGWKVDAFIRVSPDVDVTQGSVASIDTSRYSAVVALDGAATGYAGRILEYVRTGGGLVLAPAAAALDALSDLRAGVATRATSSATAIQASGSVNLASLPLAPITSLRGDAVPLEKRSANVAVAARRIGAGRVLQFGYEDTWRWRMGGGPSAVRDHRTWWTSLVSSVAYAPRIQRSNVISAGSSAPVADLVNAIGPAVPDQTVANRGQNRSHWMTWLFAIMSLALIGEIASRRLRGAR
jgi:hypothetical protein